jgi:hypothetical protein
MLATTIHNSNTTPHHQDGATTRRVVSGPNSVFSGSLTGQRPAPIDACRAPGPAPLQHPAPPGPPHPMRGGLVMLLRKEVIQPHLPVRLPCYDFVPIADPTFDSSLPSRG